MTDEEWHCIWWELEETIVPELRAENRVRQQNFEALLAENAALRELVQPLAQAAVEYDEDAETAYTLFWLDGTDAHALVKKAQALLSANSQE